MGSKLILKLIDRVLEKRFGSSTNVIREIKDLKKEVKELKKNSHPPIFTTSELQNIKSRISKLEKRGMV